MAEEEKVNEERRGAGAKKIGSGLIIALLLLTVAAIGSGGGLGYLLAGTVESAVNARAAAKPQKAEEEPLRYTGDLLLKEMKPVVVNLAAPSSTYVRVEASIVFKKGALSNPDITIAQIREDVMAYMHTLSLSQLEGPSAMQHLREDLNDRAATRSEGKISELVLQTLVVQ